MPKYGFELNSCTSPDFSSTSPAEIHRAETTEGKRKELNTGTYHVISMWVQRVIADRETKLSRLIPAPHIHIITVTQCHGMPASSTHSSHAQTFQCFNHTQTVLWLETTMSELTLTTKTTAEHHAYKLTALGSGCVHTTHKSLWSHSTHAVQSNCVRHAG